ncbi:neuralized [Carabus blaptoides fortunei]
MQKQVQLPQLRYQPAQLTYNPVPLHRPGGRSVLFSHNRCVVARSDAEFCHGYVFTARPLVLNERMVVHILSTASDYVGSLALGVTSCDPSYLQPGDSSADADLRHRPEYWVVNKDFASNPQLGDEISFCVSHTGEVQIYKKGGTPTVMMHIDYTLKLWALTCSDQHNVSM